MTESSILQNGPEFKSRRYRSIGGSDAPVVVGLSDYVTPYHLLEYKRKKEKAEPIEETDDMRLGHEHEERIAQLFSLHTGNILRTPCMFTHPLYVWYTSNPDRLRIQDNTVVEIKLKTKQDELPEYPRIDHIVQLHHQMTSIGSAYNKKFGFIIYGLLKNLSACVVFWIKRNEKLSAEWDKKKEEFWSKVELPEDATPEELKLSYEAEGTKNWKLSRIQEEFQFKTIIRIS